MEVDSFALRYVPFGGMLLVAALVVLDARVRIKRPSRTRYAAGSQMVLAIGMLVLAVVALIVSPDVGLLELTDKPAEVETFPATLSAYAALGGLAVVPLITGLVLPADPGPRKGLTVLALTADAVAVVTTVWLIAGPQLLAAA